MNRIETLFQRLKAERKKALITFVTAGDPTLATTVALCLEMEKAGADLIELGVPYSDPIAEGPVIQAANRRALANRIHLPDIMRTAKTIRDQSGIPLVYLLYYNCILQYGAERFMRDSSESGVDGLIVPDLPLEEKGELAPFAERHGIALIPMVTPVSGDRIGPIVREAKGFVYCVSSLGVTGVRDDFSTNFEHFFAAVRKHTDLPTALGFGISTPEQAKSLKEYADGIIVGSAIVQRIGTARNPDDAVRSVGEFVNSLRSALDQDRPLLG